MANTCTGYDSTAPDDILKAIKEHIKADQEKNKTNSRWLGRTHLDEDDACLVWDLCECDAPYAAVCREDDCVMSRTGKKVRSASKRKPL